MLQRYFLICLMMIVPMGSAVYAEPASVTSEQILDYSREIQSGLAAGKSEFDLPIASGIHIHIDRKSDGLLSGASLTLGGEKIPTYVATFSDPLDTLDQFTSGHLVRHIESRPLEGGGEHIIDTITPLTGHLPAVRKSYDFRPTEDNITIIEETDIKRTGAFTDSKSVYTVSRREVAGLLSTPQSALLDSSCTDSAHNSQLKKSFTDALKMAHTCLSPIDPTLETRLLGYLALGNVHLVCDQQGVSKGMCANAVDSPNPLWWVKGLLGFHISIAIDPSAFIGMSAGCPNDLAETLFHESLHYVLGVHPHPEMNGGSTDPNDSVFGCQHFCYGQRTAQNCAACFGLDAHSVTCSKFSHPPPSDEPTSSPTCVVSYTGDDQGTFPCYYGIRRDDPYNIHNKDPQNKKTEDPSRTYRPYNFTGWGEEAVHMLLYIGDMGRTECNDLLCKLPAGGNLTLTWTDRTAPHLDHEFYKSTEFKVPFNGYGMFILQQPQGAYAGFLDVTITDSKEVERNDKEEWYHYMIHGVAIGDWEDETTKKKVHVTIKF